MKIQLMAALGLTLLGSGCVTIEERRTLDAQQCAGYGFRTGTDAFAQCMQDIDLERAASRRAWAYRDIGGPYGGIGFGYGYGRW